MFMGIDIQGKSMSLCDPTNRMKQLQQQQLQQQQQQGIVGGFQSKESQLPNMISNVNTNNYLNNGSSLQQQNSIIQQSGTKQTSIKYNSPLSHQHQFKIGHQNKLEYIRQQQVQKYNQLYQLDPQLQQQNQIFQQNQYAQNLQMQQQLLFQNNSEMFPPFNSTSSNNTQNSVLLQQYLSSSKNQGNNANSNRDNIINYHSDQSPKSATASNPSNNTQFATNILRNSNMIQQQNEFRFQQIQQTHQLLHQLVSQQQQQPLSQNQQQSNQSSQSSNPSSQSPLPLQISSQQPVASMANYFNQPQQNNSAFPGQQQQMFNSSENFGQKNILYSCVGNPNNPYNHHINNPYLQEKRYYKSSKLPKIRKDSKQQPVAFSDIRPSSREKSARFHLTASINTIVNSNGTTNVSQNNENLVQSLKGQNYSTIEKSSVVQSETNIPINPKTQTLIKEQSLTNINSASKENNQLSLATSNQGSKKIYENIPSTENDEEEKVKCIRYFRYNFGQLLYILGKKETYFSNLNSKKPIKTFAMLNQQLGVNILNIL